MSGSKFEMARRPLTFIAANCFEGERPRGIYSFVISECVNWVKNAILKAYEFVPQVYHQKMRNYHKQHMLNLPMRKKCTL